MNNNERIARWLGWTADKFLPPVWYFKDGDSVMRVKDFKPDTDITLWHGKDGLFDKIGGNWSMYGDFLTCLKDVIDIPYDEWQTLWSIWMVCKATPAQLTDALIEVIEEEKL